MTMVEIIAIITTGILCVLCVVCIIALIGNQRRAKANSKAIQDIEKSLSSFGDSIKSKTDQLIDHMERQQVDELQTQRLEFLEQEVLRLSELEKKAEAKTAPADTSDTAGTVSAPDGIYKPEELYGLDEIEEIEEIDDEIELDDLFRELEAMGAEEVEKPVEEQKRQGPKPAVQAVPIPQPVQPVQTAPIEPQLPDPPVQSQPVPQAQPQPVPQAPPQPDTPAPQPTRYHQGYNIGRSGKKYTAEELNMLIRE